MTAKTRRYLLPELSRGGVLLVDTDTQILPIHANLVSEEFVGQENRLLLVVRSKREVAQHLEHGLMTGSEPNLGINYNR